MTLIPGARLGPYEIVALLGVGGMGEVYRARDTRLGRAVAIKVILDVFASDPERVARFEREAKVLASLNHPRIAALYGMEEAEGRHFLVMELVEGETLADRLQRGALPIDQTLAIAVQIADALEAAHEKGIVHRDLKPANVKITPDDTVKVLDFGLAKAIESESAAINVANSPTLSMMASQAGIILGTAAYMSPEQAKGFPADHRSDVFSFGTVLFEMLSGRRPFQGDTAPEVLASVLVRDPDITTLPTDLNPRLTELVRRCLEKQPKRRWQAIGDVRAELEAIAASPRTAPVSPGLPLRPPWKRALPAVISAIVVGLFAAVGAWRLKPPPPGPVGRFSITLPEGKLLSGTNRQTVAISPDGAHIVFVANGQLFLRSLTDLQANPIPGTSLFVATPTFSPDGTSIAFFAGSDQSIKRIAVTGGGAVTICPVGSNPYGISWDRHGIIFGQAEVHAIQRVSADGGRPETLIALKNDEVAHAPQLLPGGEWILFTLARGIASDRWEKAQIVVQSVRSGERKVLIDGGGAGHYLSSGHLVYALGGTVYAVAFDLDRLVLAGGPVAVIEGVRRAMSNGNGAADVDVSANGSLAYVPGSAGVSTAQMSLALIDVKGAIASLSLPPGAYQTPRISHDGKRVAFGIDDGKDANVYVYDIAGSTAMKRVTFGGTNRLPIWSADSKRVAFQSDRQGDLGIFWQPADGTGTTERLTKPVAGESHVPLSWHPAGDALLFDVTKGKDVTLWLHSLRSRTVERFGAIQSPYPTGAVFSPDGRWVAYGLYENKTGNVYVQPFPATGAKYQVAKRPAEEPHHPVWSPDSRQIFFIPGPGAFNFVSVTTAPAFGLGNPTQMARAFQGAPPMEQRSYDMAPDGRILGIVGPGQSNSSGQSTQQIHVVLNWFEELKAKVPTR
ncbi:MAG: protein kinase [Vicinamibacterales bacterium]